MYVTFIVKTFPNSFFVLSHGVFIAKQQSRYMLSFVAGTIHWQQTHT